MKRILTVLCLLAALVFAGVASAQTQTATFNLSWTDNATTETGFRIERCTGVNCTSFATIGNTTANVVTYSDVIANDPGGVTQRYRVLAFNAGGNSAYSNIAQGTSPVVVIQPPIGPSNVAVSVSVTVTVGP
jgi:hypothetical protein